MKNIEKVYEWFFDQAWPVALTVILGVLDIFLGIAIWVAYVSNNISLSLAIFGTIIPPIVLASPFIIAGIMDVWPLARQFAESWISRKKEISIRKKKDKSLSQIPKGRLQPFRVGDNVSTINVCLAEEICREVVSDVLQRSIAEDERVDIIDLSNLPDESVLVIFRYRRHIRRKTEEGSFDDQITASVHVVRMQLNKIGDFVNVFGVISIDAEDFEGLGNPNSLITRIKEEVVSPSTITPLEARTTVVPEVPARQGIST